MESIKTIIIEDEYIVALHLEHQLTELGHEVIGSYSSGEKMLEDLGHLEPDLFLMDIMLAGKLDGIEVGNEVRKVLDVPIIYLTAYNTPEIVKRAAKINPEAYIVKPIDEDVLRTNIEVVIGNYKLKIKEAKKSKENATILKDKNSELEKNNEMMSMNVDELTVTNEHLITATFREREMKKELSATLDELEITKGNLEHQNTRIRESINYAETIQGSILPDNALIRRSFEESFIYYIPKDVVSGDFPWFHKKGDDIYIAAVDCTGHGVPGAMLSFVGYFLLNEITGHRRVLSSSEVLEHLHTGVVNTLRQNEEGCRNARDGMDIALCKINLKTMELEYSGAHRPLYLVQDGELIQVKGDKHPIGGTQWKKKRELVYAGSNGEDDKAGELGIDNESSNNIHGNSFREFTNHKIKIKKGDSVFFFSDGMPDQFGGDEGLKYGPKRIRETILANPTLDMSQIHDVFKKDFEKWMENSKQIDDVLMIGLKF